MINELIDGVCIALNTEFGDGYEIYTESIEQGLTEPCFFVQCINPTFNEELTNRTKNTFLFMIQYFPESNTDAYAEINSVIERLYKCLKSVPYCDISLCGSDMSASTVEKVLNFQVSFDFFTININNTESMETFTMKEGLNNE